MHTVSLEEAQAHLVELVEEASRGGEVLIIQKDKPAVKLAAVPAAAPSSTPTEPEMAAGFPLYGILKGKIIYHEGWDEPDEDFRPYAE